MSRSPLRWHGDEGVRNSSAYICDDTRVLVDGRWCDLKNGVWLYADMIIRYIYIEMSSLQVSM